MKQRPLYEERTGWAWWVHPLILLTLVAAVIPMSEFAKGNVGNGPGAMPLWAAALSFLVGIGIPGAIYSLMGQLRTRITEEHIDIRWGYLEVIKKSLSSTEALVRAQDGGHHPESGQGLGPALLVLGPHDVHRLRRFAGGAHVGHQLVRVRGHPLVGGLLQDRLEREDAGLVVADFEVILVDADGLADGCLGQHCERQKDCRKIKWGPFRYFIRKIRKSKN